MRFPIRFDRVYGLVSTALLLFPSDSFVEVAGDSVHVRMGWGFRSSFPLSAVRGVTPLARRPLSRGVHGFAGRWLVNGSGDGILTIELEPAQRAHVLGFPVRLRELLVSLEEPDALARSLMPVKRI